MTTTAAPPGVLRLQLQLSLGQYPECAVTVVGFVPGADSSGAEAAVASATTSGDALALDVPFLERDNCKVVLHLFAHYKNDDAGAWSADHVLGFALLYPSALQAAGAASLPLALSVQDVRGRVVGRVTATLLNFAAVAAGPRCWPAAPGPAGLEARRDEAVLAAARLLLEAKRRVAGAVYSKQLSGPLGGGAPQFVGVGLRGHQVPVLAVLASAGRLRGGAAEAARLCNWWLRVAKANLGLDPARSLQQLVAAAAAAAARAQGRPAGPATLEAAGAARAQQAGLHVLAQVLGEFFTLPMKAMLYCHDSSRGADGKVHHDDTWNSAFVYPPGRLARAGFDCEDGAIAAMQLFALLRDARLDARDAALEDLRYVQRWFGGGGTGEAPVYAVGMALGQIKTGGPGGAAGYCYHAFPVLLDARWLGGPARAAPLLETVLLETTNYLASTFARASGGRRAAEERAFNQQDEVVDALVGRGGEQAHPDAGLGWRFLVHYRGPAALMRQELLYGHVHSVYSAFQAGASARDGSPVRMTQYHARYTGSAETGVDCFHLLDADAARRVQLVEVSHITAAEMASMDAFLCENCPAQLPEAPASPRADLRLGAGLMRFIVTHRPAGRERSDGAASLRGPDFQTQEFAHIARTLEQRFAKVKTAHVELFKGGYVALMDVPKPGLRG